ncbi:DNA gyrase inhibitor [BD1-7 clade bacterium]|uniref:DNA gyrase inhibitor n=1 Tax=BD1-7 clade bacterium TaxID=2029982 RepID=A0A5S9PGY6_9GAMM|nr:DNA gyrase inhibitor [BD1-7 clade bacterium]CAA0103428.1 DNA gyrase inhibitor [BD1-7 clade bacterium]
MNKTYKARIDRVLQHIEATLPNKILLADLAETSHFSVFHFHRIFTGIMDETVNDYVARRRLECAVNQLIFKTVLSITEVAHRNGYSSSANFSKAVKIHFGFTPSEIRNPNKIKNSKIGNVSSKYGKAFNPPDLYPNRITNNVMNTPELESTQMNMTVKERDSQRVCTMASQSGYEPTAIFAAWDKLIAWAENNGIDSSQQERFAFAFDNPTVTPIDKCRYTTSIAIGNDLPVNAPFEVSEIPKGKYAVLYYKGSPEETIDAQLSIYSDWLPDSGFEPDDFPMLERYLNDPRVDGYLEMEIHVKLKEVCG